MRRLMMLRPLVLFFLSCGIGQSTLISDSKSLVKAAREAKPDPILELSAGTFLLTEALELPSGITLKGVGMEKTIITNTTATPRKEGLFGFNSKSDFSSFVTKDNLIECTGLSRPLFRDESSSRSKVEGNQLMNVSDSDRFMNAKKAGLGAPLKFTCGVHRELTVDGWTAKPTSKK